MAKPKDPIEYLIKGWLTAGEVSIFAGPSGSGKTFVVLDMAMSIARAVAFLGRYRVNGGGVVYQAGEGAKGLRDKRIPAYMTIPGTAAAKRFGSAIRHPDCERQQDFVQQQQRHQHDDADRDPEDGRACNRHQLFPGLAAYPPLRLGKGWAVDDAHQESRRRALYRSRRRLC